MIGLRRCFGNLLPLALLPSALHAQTSNLLFDGVDDQATLPNSVLNDIGTGPFTVEAWVRGVEADQTTHPRILSNRDVMGNGLMFFFHGLWGGSSHKMLCLQMQGFNYMLIDNGSYDAGILDGGCHHVAVSKDVDSLRFYVDGMHIGSRALIGDPSAATSATDMLIGNDAPDPHPFNGNLSQVRLWDHVRSQAEIAANLGLSIPGTSPGLLGYWELNEGSGQSIADKTNTTNGILGITPNVEPTDPAWADDCCDLGPVHTSIDRPLASQGLRAHPNPARDLLRIELPECHGTAELMVADITGRVVLRTDVTGRSRALLDVSHLRASAYVLHLRAGSFSHALRFVKD